MRIDNHLFKFYKLSKSNLVHKSWERILQLFGQIFYLLRGLFGCRQNRTQLLLYVEDFVLLIVHFISHIH